MKKFLKFSEFVNEGNKKYDKVFKELKRIQKSNGIRIYAHAGVPEDLEMKFISPIFTKKDLDFCLDFLKGTKTIIIKAQPTVVGKWSVEYDGTVENDKGEEFEFEKINNGIARVPG